MFDRERERERELMRAFRFVRSDGEWWGVVKSRFFFGIQAVRVAVGSVDVGGESWAVGVGLLGSCEWCTRIVVR